MLLRVLSVLSVLPVLPVRFACAAFAPVPPRGPLTSAKGDGVGELQAESQVDASKR